VVGKRVGIIRCSKDEILASLFRLEINTKNVCVVVAGSWKLGADSRSLTPLFPFHWDGEENGQKVKLMG